MNTAFRSLVGRSLNSKMEQKTTFPKEGENRVDFVTLEVRKSNIAAQELYKKYNYELVTTKRNYYEDGEDALYMVKGV